jgi:hypothetical protein
MCKVVVKLCLYGFNVAMFLGCLAVLAVQIFGTSEGLASMGIVSPELVVLGITLVCLWVLSIVGLVGAWKRRGRTLRM